MYASDHNIPIHGEALSKMMEYDDELGAKLDKVSHNSPEVLGSSDSSSSMTHSSTLSATEIFKTAHSPCKNEFESAYTDEAAEKYTEPHASMVCLNNTLRSKLSIDHVYEEVTALTEPNLAEYDILDYYEKYSPTTAKTLINTLFLPRHKICKQCASIQESPVYTDSLIYGKQPLYAKEVEVCYQKDISQFKYCKNNEKHGNTLVLQFENIQHHMLVCNYLKTTASSIFYLRGPPQDIFDLQATLKPSILLVNNIPQTPMNTHLYHRNINNFYIRISKSGNIPMSFHVNHDNILRCIKHIGYDTDLQNWMHYRDDVLRSRSLKKADVAEYRPNRSSLLLLEPLLLMPDLTTSRQPHDKNISDSEHVKIVKIVIAYTLSFLILATITFYVVYFT